MGNFLWIVYMSKTTKISVAGKEILMRLSVKSPELVSVFKEANRNLKSNFVYNHSVKKYLNHRRSWKSKGTDFVKKWAFKKYLSRDIIPLNLTVQSPTCVFFFLLHSLEKQGCSVLSVYAADGQPVEMEDVYSFFNNKNCPALQVSDNPDFKGTV